MANMIELTDLRIQYGPVIVPVTEVGRTIRDWYGSPTSVIEDSVQIDEFQEALLAEDYSEACDLAAELGIGFDLPR